MDDAELEAQQRHDDRMLVEKQNAALAGAAEAVLTECGIDVDDVLNEDSWISSRSFAVPPAALSRLGRCLLAVRKRPPVPSPTRVRPVDVRGALARCREARERLSLQGYIFEPWTELLEAMAERMVGKPLCALCAANVPHTDSVCVERRERRLRAALRELVEATDRRSRNDARDVDERIARAQSVARALLDEV